MARISSALWMAGLLVIGGVTATSAQEPTAQPAGLPRVIELEATASIEFHQDGAWIGDIPVVPGETVRFRIDNSAGFAQNFYIGSEVELSVPAATTEVGIPDWSSGVRELTWTVPEDIDWLMWACTVPGHYPTMHGTFSPAASLPDGSMERLTPEPTPKPTPEPVPMLSGRVEVPWAGVAMTFPEDWLVDVDDGVLFAYRPEGDGGWCQLRLHDAAGYDRMAAVAESDALLTLGGAGAVRFDMVLPDPYGTAYYSTYIVVSSGTLYEFTCSASQRTLDHWLSIAETIEFLLEE